MTDEEWIQKHLATAPALSGEQRSRLASILSHRPAPSNVVQFPTPAPSHKAA